MVKIKSCIGKLYIQKSYNDDSVYVNKIVGQLLCFWHFPTSLSSWWVYIEVYLL